MQKTAYELHISDWSSDVCSSDLSTRRISSRPRPPTLTPARARPTKTSSTPNSPKSKTTRSKRKGMPFETPFRQAQWLLRANGFFQSVRPEEGLSEVGACPERLPQAGRSEEHTSELQSLMRLSYAVFC